MGSIVYLGLTFGKKINLICIGSLMATPIFCYLKARYILATSFILNGLALLVFTLTSSFFLLAISRFLVGFCQVTKKHHSNPFIDIHMHIFTCLGRYIWHITQQNTHALPSSPRTTPWRSDRVHPNSDIHSASHLALGFLYIGCDSCSAYFTRIGNDQRKIL